MTTENKTKNNAVKVSKFIILLGLIAPAGYLIGFSYYQGIMDAFGTNIDAFSVSTSDMYINAYLVISFYLGDISSLAAVIFNAAQSLSGLLGFSLFFIVVLSYLSIKKSTLLRPERVNNVIDKAQKMLSYLHIKNNNFTFAFAATAITTYTLLVILILIMSIFLLWITMPFAAYNKGNSMATEEINTYLEKSCFVDKNKKWSNCTTLKSSKNEVIYTGLLVTYKNDTVAFFTKEGSFVFKMPEGAVFSHKRSN